MAKQSLRERKEQLVNKWEEIFEQKIGDHLSIKGLSVFWSDDTSYEGAVAMLDKAALLMVVQEATDNINVSVNGNELVIVIDRDNEEEGEEDGDVRKPFEVERVPDNWFFVEKFETEDEARQFIREQAMTTPYTLKDFRVVKVY